MKATNAFFMTLAIAFAFSARIQAQFLYTTVGETITITGYTGSGRVVVIPSTINNLPVTSIGGAAFDGSEYRSLTSVTIPNSVTSIGDGAFSYCTGLTSVTIGNRVTTIGDGAFYLCTGLASVTIPNSVASIGDSSFSECTSLTSVTIGIGVTNIGDDAFNLCNDLTSVTIPNSVTTIGDTAFSDCTDLTSMTIGNGVTNIGHRAFSECDALTAINVATGNRAYSSVGGVYLNLGQTSLIEYPGGGDPSYTIPDSVTTIADNAFEVCIGLTNVTIPDSVTTIGDNAFLSCPSLTSVTIGDGVTTIGDTAFDSCTGLASVTIGNRVATIGDYAFSDCTDLTSVRIPNSVTNIGEGAFYVCTGLTSVTIGNGVTNIGDDAFDYCSNLTSLYFEGNATSADSTVFYDAPATAYYLNGTTGWSVFSATTGIPAVLLNPPIPASIGGFGITNHQFGFTITVPVNAAIVVQACTNLANGVWLPLLTNTLANGSIYFSDSAWTNYPSRFYRVQFPLK